MRQKELAGLLRGIADWLESATSEDVKSLVEGRGRFHLEIDEVPQSSSSEKTFEPSIDLESIRVGLEQAPSIEEALAILHSTGVDKRRKQLEQLGRSYKVAIRKSEPMSDLAHRIVSAVVGTRLHAEITQGLSLSRRSKE